MNNHGNISFAVRACGLHRCYKPGAGNVAPPTSSISPVLVWSHSASSWKSPVQMDKRHAGVGPETSGTAPRSRKQTSTQACHPLPPCSRVEGCGHLPGKRDGPREGRKVLDSHFSQVSSKVLLHSSKVFLEHTYTHTHKTNK